MASEISKHFDLEYIDLPKIGRGLAEWKHYGADFGGKNTWSTAEGLHKLVDQVLLQEIFKNNGCVYIQMKVSREDIIYVKHRALPRFVTLTKDNKLSNAYNVSISEEGYSDYKQMIVDYFKEGKLFIKVKK